MRLHYNFKRMIALIIVACMMVMIVPMSVSAGSTEWSIVTEGNSKTKIYWVSTSDSKKDDADLKEQIQLFSQEMAAKSITASTLEITYGPLSQAGSNDIVVYLDGAFDITEQGYQVEVSGGQVVIKASDKDGLFYGCRYVLQALHPEYQGVDMLPLTVGQTYTSSPDVLERGVSLDCARKYFKKDWIMYLIREMSWYNLNALTLHFSEDMGIRLEHPTYDWLAGSDNDLCPKNNVSFTYAKDNTIVTETYTCNDADEGKYLTIAELKEIVAYANLYHVEIIPSFDSPGHLNYMVEKYNAKYGTDIGSWLNMDGVNVQKTQTTSSRGIDISNETAVAFTMDVIKGYAELFKELGCTKFDMGGDELLGSTFTVDGTKYYRWQDGMDHWKAYAIEQTGNENATAYDAFMLYMNNLAEMLWDMGYESVRMWNDDAYRTYDTGYDPDNAAVKLDPRIEISFWKKNVNNAQNTVQTYLSRGHNVYNYYNDFNYYVVMPNGVYPYNNYDQILNYWNPYVFECTGTSGAGNVLAVAQQATGSEQNQVKGTAYCIWCDCPDFKTEAEVMADIRNSLRANGMKSWDSDAQNTMCSSAQFPYWTMQIGLCPGGNDTAYIAYSLPSVPTVTVLIDNAELQSIVDAYDEDEAELYTSSSFALYTAAVEEGRTVLNNANATQEEIDAAVSKIQEAQLTLVKRADTTALQAAIDEFDSVNGDAYTAESNAAYQAALEGAKSVLNNADATQDEVDAAVIKLNEAKNALVVNEDTCQIVSLCFRTSRVRNGGKAVLCVGTSKDTIDFKLVDDQGNEINDFEILRLTNSTEVDGVIYSYLKFTVNGSGTRSYTVTVDGQVSQTTTLSLWQAAN